MIALVSFIAGIIASNPYVAGLIHKTKKEMKSVNGEVNDYHKYTDSRLKELMAMADNLRQENDQWRNKYEEANDKLEIYEIIASGDEKLQKEYAELKKELDEIV